MSEPSQLKQLHQLHTDIDKRVIAIREDYPNWLCGKGCDSCCKRLAEVPLLSEAEWELLREGLAALPEGQLQVIREAMVALEEQTSRPVVCPFLDHATNACPVYAHRPVACRSYGFYRQRDLGLYCQDIQALVESDQLDHVVWGNHDPLDQHLARLGESRSLTAWFASWQQASVGS